MKSTTMIQTGAFSLPSSAEFIAAGPRERCGTAGAAGTVGLRSAYATIGSALAVRNTADVPTPVPVRYGGAYG